MASACQQPYDGYASGYASELDPTLVAATKRVVELAEPRPGIRLLDVATGTGTIARAAAARGASVVAIDASAGMLEVAQTLSPEMELRLGDVAALPFSEGVSVQTESFRGEFADVADAVAWATAWPLAAVRLARLEPSRRDQFFSDARAALVGTSLSWSFAFNFYVAHRPRTDHRG